MVQSSEFKGQRSKFGFRVILRSSAFKFKQVRLREKYFVRTQHHLADH